MNVSEEEVPHAPAYVLANFGARMAERHGLALSRLVEDAQADGSAIESVPALKSALGMTPGKEVFSQEIELPAEFGKLLKNDRDLVDLWRGPEALGEPYSGVDLVRQGYELLQNVEHFLIWTAIGLQFVNIRVAIEKPMSKTTKAEIGFGTNGLSFSFKKQIGQIFEKKKEQVASSFSNKVDHDGPEALQEERVQPPSALTPSQELVSYIRDPRSPDAQVGGISALFQSGLLNIGSLFTVNHGSSFSRVQVLAKLASLYWEVNTDAVDVESIPFTFETVHGKLRGSSAADKRMLAEWPRGFKIDVGERLTEGGETKPFVTIISPRTIPGTKATYSNYRASKAGRIADFIKAYLGSEEVLIYFSQNERALYIETGTSCTVGRDGGQVRGLVLSMDNAHWGIIPGHAILKQPDRGKPLVDVVAASVGSRVFVEFSESGTSGLREVGAIAATKLTESQSFMETKGRAIDAAFCRLERPNSRTGFGIYTRVAPTIAGALVSDWLDYRDRLIVTVNVKGHLRWGRISSHLASKHLEAPDTGHRFIVTNTLQVQTVGNFPFADPGMSGSLAFLTPPGTEPSRTIESEVYLIGYVVGRSKYHAVEGDNRHTPNVKGSIPDDFSIQLLPGVFEELQKFVAAPSDATIPKEVGNV